jgi:mxaA protein
VNRRIVSCLAIPAALAAFAVAQPGAAQSAKGPDAAADSVEAIVQQPRAFGYVLGDVFTQRVLLQLAAAPFEPATLPKNERVGVWLERRASRIETAADGRRWLAVEYQLINAPHALTTVTLSDWELASKQGGVKLIVPEWSISVSALTPATAFDAGGLGELRPDRQAAVIASAPIRRQVQFWSISLVVTLMAWFAWMKWRDRLAVSNQPFARAWHEMRRLDASTPQAWQALHRAFDRTAGRVMHAETLALLFQRAPHLQPLREQIERFFAASSERFFGSAAQDAAMSIRSLCEELRRLERRYER